MLLIGRQMGKFFGVVFGATIIIILTYPHDPTRKNPSQRILNNSVKPAGFPLARQRHKIVLVLHEVGLGMDEQFLVLEPSEETGDVARTGSFEGGIGLDRADQFIWKTKSRLFLCQLRRKKKSDVGKEEDRLIDWANAFFGGMGTLTVFFQLVFNLPHHGLTGVIRMVIRLFIMLPRFEHQRVIFLILDIEVKEFLLEYGELVLAIQELPTSEKPPFSGDQEVVVAIDEGGYSGVAFGMVFDCGQGQRMRGLARHKSLLRWRRIGLPSPGRCLAAKRVESFVDLNFCKHVATLNRG